jgi:hypothetical protein
MLGLIKNKRVTKFEFVGKHEAVKEVKLSDELEFFRNVLIGYHKGEIMLTDEGLEMIFQKLQSSESVDDVQMTYIS